MNTPSPLLPQGATPPRPKSSLYIKILMILSVHVVVIGGMLLQGCKDTSKDAAKDGAVPVTTDATPPSTTPLATSPAPMPDPTPVANPALATSTNVESPIAAVPAPMPIAPASAGLIPPAKGTDLNPPAATGEAKEYVIAKGDTLGAIARKNGMSIKTLMEANPGVNPKKLHPGQKVQIPAALAATATAKETAPGAEVVAADGAVYVVKSGDMLLKIAKAHGTTVKKIMAMNELKSTSIRVGQKLKLPSAKTSSVDPVAAPATASMPDSAPMKVSAATRPAGTSVAAN